LVVLAMVIVANGANIRIKRDVKTVILDDPSSCVHHCWISYNATSSWTTRNTKRLMHRINNNKVDEQYRSVSRQTGETYTGTGVVFLSNCKDAGELKTCIEQCPDSELRKLALAESTQSDVYCLPHHGTQLTFTDFYDKLQCVNNALSTDPRFVKCNATRSVQNVTFLNFRHVDEDHTHSIVYYNDDKARNTDEVKRVCKRLHEQYVCYKPLLIDRCQQSGYDLYVRITKVETKKSLAMLRELDAVDDDIHACREHQPYNPNQSQGKNQSPGKN